MKGGDTVYICLCGCNAELPSRYKGRQRIFMTSECRRKWHLENPNKIAVAPLIRTYP